MRAAVPSTELSIGLNWSTDAVELTRPVGQSL